MWLDGPVRRFAALRGPKGLKGIIWAFPKVGMHFTHPAAMDSMGA